MPSPTRLAAILAGDTVPAFRATSHHMSVLLATLIETGIIDPKTGEKVPGIPRGLCGPDGNGGVFFYDEFMLHEAGLLNNYNRIILGLINERKSAGVKTEILLGSQLGYQAIIVDIKGEYDWLASPEFIPGAKVLEFGEDAEVSINPLDPSISHDDQMLLLNSLASTSMTPQGSVERTLSIREYALLEQAARDAKSHFGHGSRGVATLPMIVEKLGNPTSNMLRGMNQYPSEEFLSHEYTRSLTNATSVMKEEGRDMYHGLKSLCEGSLGGMVGRETTEGLFENTPLLVFKGKGINEAQAKTTVILVNHFVQSMLSKHRSRYHFDRIYYDEAWDLSKYAGFAHSVRRAVKLGRSAGFGVCVIMHHLMNMKRSGGADVIEDIISDTGTFVLHRQSMAELQASQNDLGLSDTLVERIAGFDERQGLQLWKVGNLPAIEVQSKSPKRLIPYLHTTYDAAKEAAKQTTTA